ncbi:MAG: zinc ribbon domain-containing protein YjdM [Tissierellaceae bacterium]
MSGLPNCPNCNSEYTYEDRGLFVCPECAHEWGQELEEEVISKNTINDANGIPLEEGDSIIVIKDLKVKGSSSAVKKGTKVKNIKLIYDATDGHDIDCKIAGFGAMKLKSEFVKKA